MFPNAIRIMTQGGQFQYIKAFEVISGFGEESSVRGAVQNSRGHSCLRGSPFNINRTNQSPRQLCRKVEVADSVRWCLDDKPACYLVNG